MYYLKIVRTTSNIVYRFDVLPTIPKRLKLLLVMDTPDQLKLALSVLLIVWKNPKLLEGSFKAFHHWGG